MLRFTGTPAVILYLCFIFSACKSEGEEKKEEPVDAGSGPKTSDISKEKIDCPAGTTLVKERTSPPGRGCRDAKGLKHGPWMEFTPTTHSKGIYERGKKEGPWEYYDDEGKFMETKHFRDGKLSSGWK